MSGYNTQNLPNFSERPIYGQLPPNDSLNLLQVTDIKLNSTIYSLTGPVVIDDDLQVNGIVECLSKTAENMTVTGDLTVEGDIITPGGIVNDRLDNLKIQNGYGQTLSVNIGANASNFIQPLTNPSNTTIYKFGAFSASTREGETYSYFTGAAKSSGTPFDENTIMPMASLGKGIGGVVFAKMVEEGYISAFDTVYQHWPVFTGTAYYYQSITVTNPVTFPYDPTSYSYTTGAYDLSTLTIQDCLRFNIGIVDDLVAVPPNLLGWQNPAVVAAAIQANAAPLSDPSGLGLILNYLTYFQAMAAGFPIGAVTYWYNNGQPGPAPNVSAYNTVLDNHVIAYRNKQIIMPFKPNTYSPTVAFPFLARALPANYDMGYLVLGIALGRRLNQIGYPGGFMGYLRDKFLTPLGMNDTFLAIADAIPAAKQSKLVDIAWRRAPIAGLTQTFNPLNPATYAGYGCDPAYAAIAGAGIGALVYASSYPTDGFSKLEFVAQNFANYGATAYPITNFFNSTVKDVHTFGRFLVNRGVHNGIRLLKTETWNFIVQPSNSSFSQRSGLPYPAGMQYNIENRCLWGYRYMKDAQGYTMFGINDNTIHNPGSSGIDVFIDLYNGTVIIYVCGNGSVNLDSTGITNNTGSDQIKSNLQVVISKP